MIRPPALLVVFGCLVLACAPAPVAAQPEGLLADSSFERSARRGLGYLYNMQYAEAGLVFDSLGAAHPGHPAAAFLGALVPWWQILSDLADTSRDDEFYEAMDEVVDRADRRLRRDPYDLDALFFKGAALSFRARLRANRRDYLRAAFDAKGAIDYVLDVARRDPGNPDYQFGKGVYDYYAATLRDDYPRFRLLLSFFARGDRERGKALLEETFEHGVYLQVEAAYQLALLNYLHERDYPAALRYVRWLRFYYPRNAFFHTLEGRIHANFGHMTEADVVFRQVLDERAAGATGYNDSAAEQAYYYLARSAMARRDYDRTLVLLFQLQQLSRERPAITTFQVLGRLRQGMAHDARGERAAAVRRYEQVLDLPDRADAHARARQYLEHPYRG